MTQIVVRSAGRFLLTALLGSLVIFGSLRLLSGDVATVILGQAATKESLASLRSSLGLDQPWPIQYRDWIWGYIQGDLGSSFASGYDIKQQILERSSVTLPLIMLALGVSSLLSLVIGTWAAIHARQRRGAIVDAITQIGISLPAFWIGLLLVSLISIRWNVLPSGGFTPWSRGFAWSLRDLILPTISLTLPLTAMLTRYVRSAMLDVLNEDYIRTARAKGFTLGKVALRHGVRNASIPIVTVIGLQFGNLLAGAVVIELVFNLPGLGRMLLTAVSGREVIVVQSLVLTLLLVILALNLLTDVLYGVLDPRMRSRSSKLESEMGRLL